MTDQTVVLEQHSAQHHPDLAHHFEDLDQQRESASLGMWLFLSTEVMLFGALFAAFTTYRYLFPHAFGLAQNELNVLLGAVNTGVLLCSSLSMALAVRAAQFGKGKLTALLLILTIILGLGFVGIKLYDWYEEYRHHLVPLQGFHFEFEGHEAPSSTRPELLFATEGSAQALEQQSETGIQPATGSPEDDVVSVAGRAKMFFTFYFIMTGLHALHMLIGVGLVGMVAFQAWRGKFSQDYYTPVENTGLYWHFVDIVWVFLFPVLYLI